MADPSEARVFTAVPTIRLDGEENERLASLIVDMVVNEQEGGLSSLELRLANVASLEGGSAELAFGPQGDLQLGAQIVIGAGETSAPVEIFRGSITGIEGIFRNDGPPQISVLAEDAMQKARFARRTKVFENSTLGDIAREIASRHGLTPKVSGLDQNFGTQVQMNETDLGFLRRLLARVDADMQVVGNEMHVSPRSQIRRGKIELSLKGELKSARILADLAHQITRSTVKGWNALAGTILKGEDKEDAAGSEVEDKGSTLMTRRFSARTHHVGRLAAFNQGEVDSMAIALRNRRARRFLRAQCMATGSPAIRVGAHVTLKELGDWFSNTYYVIKVRHLFDLQNGYRTEFEGECDSLGKGAP